MSETKYAIFHIEKYKTISSMVKSYNHNYRQIQKKTINDSPGSFDNFENVNFAKSHLNQELITGYKGQCYSDEFKVALKELGNQKLRKDAVLGFDIMLTFSNNGVKESNIQAWAEANVKWLQKAFGASNVKSVMLHRDELTPHIHAFVLPISNGRFCAKEVLGNATKMRMRQTDYANNMQSFGLSRGITAGNVSHIKMANMHGDLEKALDKMDKVFTLQRNVLGRPESASDFQERVKPVVEDLTVKLKRQELELKRLWKIEKTIIKKDNENSRIQKAIENNVETQSKAEKWMILEDEAKKGDDPQSRALCKEMIRKVDKLQRDGYDYHRFNDDYANNH